MKDTSGRDFPSWTGTTMGAAVLPFLRARPAHALADGIIVAGQTMRCLDPHRTSAIAPLVRWPQIAMTGLSALARKTRPVAGCLATTTGLGLNGAQGQAAEVKGSFDRAVSAGGFPTVQMVGDETVVLTLDKPSELTLPDLAGPVPLIINATVVVAHATDDDPWAKEYPKAAPAGSGAFRAARQDQDNRLFVNAPRLGSVDRGLPLR